MPRRLHPLRHSLIWLMAAMLTAAIASVALAEAGLDFPVPAANAPVEISTQKLPLADADLPYSTFLETTLDLVGLLWTVDGSLPAGLELDRWTGELHGVPRQPGKYIFDIRVSDASGRSHSRSFEFYVLDYIRDKKELPPTPPASDGRSSVQAPSGGARAKLSAPVAAQQQPASASTPNLSGLLDILEATAEGDWVRVNLNFYNDVWAPPELQPLKGLGPSSPSKIISAWSSFAWDSNRGDLVLFGGGHANSTGNDVYRWRGTTRLWERASLPSEIRLLSSEFNYWEATDGAENAPASAHTYDGNIFLPVLDRFVTFGGAAINHGGPFKTDDPASPTGYRSTGPYLFDPSKADPDKVGGTTGSHVQRVDPYPNIIGGEMWENRDAPGYDAANRAIPKSLINNATGYAQENGKDVVYLSARSGGTAAALYKVTFNDIDAPELDTWEFVGRFWNGGSRKGAGAFDPAHNIFVRATGDRFLYWSLDQPGPSNRDVVFTPIDPSGEFDQSNLENYGLDYDPVDENFVIWSGGGDVWVLDPPAVVGPDGWTLVKQPTPQSATPTNDLGTGVLGKWQYIAGLDAFMLLQDQNLGNIWLYKPVGWQRPGDGTGNNGVPPTADFGSTCNGLSCDFVDSSSDSDGSIVAWVWDFGDDSTSTAQNPSHSYAADGNYAVTLTVTDDDGASDTTSQTVTVSSGGGSTSIELIVDNQDANTERTGTWQNSSGASPWAGQSVYNNSGSVFRWLPAITESGRYKVYAWWTYHTNRSDAVPYRVGHDGGVSTVIVNQHDPAQAGQWVLLGEHEFAAGTGYVEVSSENGQASADAVRLVKSGGASNTPPTADFSSTCELLACSFTNGSTDSDGSIASWSWYFGDGMTSTAQSPSHSYASDGSYEVTLTVTDDGGASDTTSQTVTVNAGGGTATDLIIDNQDANTERTGNWKTSSGADPWAGQSVYNNSDSAFRWLPAIAESGRYQVFAWWTYHGNRSDNVPYRIGHDGGVSTVIVNQHDPALAGQWVLLGEYDFAAGTGSVEVSSENGQASADAVRLVKISGN